VANVSRSSAQLMPDLMVQAATAELHSAAALSWQYWTKELS
jgi:hypothetical protein